MPIEHTGPQILTTKHILDLTITEVGDFYCAAANLDFITNNTANLVTIQSAVDFYDAL